MTVFSLTYALGALLGGCVVDRDLATEPACAEVIEAYAHRRDAVAKRLTDLQEQHRRLTDALHDLDVTR